MRKGPTTSTSPLILGLHFWSNCWCSMFWPCRKRMDWATVYIPIQQKTTNSWIFYILHSRINCYEPHVHHQHQANHICTNIHRDLLIIHMHYIRIPSTSMSSYRGSQLVGRPTSTNSVWYINWVPLTSAAASSTKPSFPINSGQRLTALRLN